jgi:hypothetical protein
MEGHTLHPITFRSVFILSYHLYLCLPCCLFHKEFLRKFLYDFIFFLIRVTCTISSFLIQLFNYPNNSVLVKFKIYASYTATLLTFKFLCHFTTLLSSAENNLNCNETSCWLFYFTRVTNDWQVQVLITWVQ